MSFTELDLNFDLSSLKDVKDGVVAPMTNIQVFPNPMQDRGFVSFQLVKGGKVTVRMTDNTGRNVQTVLDELLQVGDHKFEWKTSTQHAAGVYYLRFEVDGKLIDFEPVVIQRF